MRISPVQLLLQLDIEGAGTEAAPVHRTENLDVAYRVERDTFRDPVLHDRQQLPNTLFLVRRVDDVEIAYLDRREIGHQAMVDAVCIDNDPAFGSLPEDLGQAHDRQRSRRDDVAENLPRAHPRQLIDIANEQQCRALRQSPKKRHIHH